MIQDVLSVRLMPDKRKRVDGLAKTFRRSRNFVVNEAIDEYLARQEEFLAAVEEGLSDARQGKLIDHDDLVAEIAALIETRISQHNR